MIIPFVVIKELFDANRDPNFRTYVNQGGTSSGKTYCIMQILFCIAMSEMSIITVVGQDLPNLKVGALRDAKTIIARSKWMQTYFDVKEAESSIVGKNGSIIEFKSYDDEQDAKSGKRDYLFVNEANGITYEVYWQLAIRTKKNIWIDYNPTARFWVHDKVIGTEDTKLIISNHKGNPFLTEEEHFRIENISDKELWNVYARGKTGKLQGLVLQNWDIVDNLPPKEEWRRDGRGLDFGFTNDPTALEHIVMAHGELWVDEEIYETGMTNPDIVERANAIGLSRHDLIIADCAEPKSIQELNNGGLWCVPSKKGKDSISIGLDIMRRYRIHFTRRSVGIIENAKSYSWRKDRDGRTTNIPKDGNDHGIDAVRYWCLDKLVQKRESVSKAHFVEVG